MHWKAWLKRKRATLNGVIQHNGLHTHSDVIEFFWVKGINPPPRWECMFPGIPEHQDSMKENSAKNDVNKNRRGFIWLCSFPGSGNSFMRYILEVIFQKPAPATSAWSTVSYSLKRGKQISFPEIYGDFNAKATPIVLKSHDIKNPKVVWPLHNIDKDEWTHESPIIFLIRDFKECVLTRLKEKSCDADVGNGRIKKFLQIYMSMLEDFDDYPGNKILIRYEDLVGTNRPFKKTLLSVSKFIIENHFEKISLKKIESNINSFIKNIENHRRNARDAYFPGCRAGNDAHFHMNNIKTKKNLSMWMEAICRNCNSSLCDKYLKCYMNKS